MTNGNVCQCPVDNVHPFGNTDLSVPQLSKPDRTLLINIVKHAFFYNAVYIMLLIMKGFITIL